MIPGMNVANCSELQNARVPRAGGLDIEDLRTDIREREKRCVLTRLCISPLSLIRTQQWCRRSKQEWKDRWGDSTVPNIRQRTPVRLGWAPSPAQLSSSGLLQRFPASTTVSLNAGGNSSQNSTATTELPCNSAPHPEFPILTHCRHGADDDYKEQLVRRHEQLQEQLGIVKASLRRSASGLPHTMSAKVQLPRLPHMAARPQSFAGAPKCHVHHSDDRNAPS